MRNLAAERAAVPPRPTAPSKELAQRLLLLLPLLIIMRAHLPDDPRGLEPRHPLLTQRALFVSLPLHVLPRAEAVAVLGHERGAGDAQAVAVGRQLREASETVLMAAMQRGTSGLCAIWERWAVPRGGDKWESRHSGGQMGE